MMRDPTSLPREPGVYLFKDGQGTVIYVGKAKSLRTRVSQYFGSGPHSPKTQALKKHIADIDVIAVRSEVEALLLENNLIKQHSPKYNIMLKDAKTYAYLTLTDEAYPRLVTTRNPGKRGTHFGPYTDGSARVELQQLACRIAKLRTCTTMPKRACLNYHLGLCTAPCIGNVTRAAYAAQVDEARMILKGDTVAVKARLEQEMRDAAAEKRYEVALERKRELQTLAYREGRQSVDRLRTDDQDAIGISRDGAKATIALFAVRKGVLRGKRTFQFDDEPDLVRSFITRYYATHDVPDEIIVGEQCWADEEERAGIVEYLARVRGRAVALTLPQRGHKLALASIAQRNAHLEDPSLDEIREALNLPSQPSVIECFDVSNLGREHIVAGMVRFVNGMPDTAGYRKFLIRTVVGNSDDYAAMHEAVRRRYERLVREHGPLPDFILIDGGAGQLASALRALEEVGLKIPIASLAKREEELYLPGEELPRKYPSNSRMMLRLRDIRDRVHRLAIGYNRARRAMRLRDETKASGK